MSELYIAAGTRTPFCKMGTSYKNLEAVELGKSSMKSLLTKNPIDPALIDEVILGCVCQPVDAANIARVIAMRAGLPKTITARTVHRNCASGLESITTAAEKIMAGRANVVLVGGVDNMSQVPFLYQDELVEQLTQLAQSRTLSSKAKALIKLNWAGLLNPKIGLKMGLTDPISGLNMGETAEILAREFDISREEQDQFAEKSHRKAFYYAEDRNLEISPVYNNGIAIEQDNGVRADSSAEKLANLRAVFAKSHGSITAGNASQISDGSVSLLLCSKEGLKQTGLEPLGRIIDFAYTGCDPKRMGLGPVSAIHKVNRRTGLGIEDASIVEINEAFAAQVIACQKALSEPEYAKKAGFQSCTGPIPDEKLNPYGGAIALGHPVGATGSRLVLTALNQLREKKSAKALISLCIGGGQGAAMWLESL